ncbi:MAG: potassium channel protein [Butyrivibrio sp.]|nr:potassium channel protein [Butyrivibrio sp.]
MTSDKTETARDCPEDYPDEYPEDCTDSCKTIDDFLNLTDEMVDTIIGLEEEVVRWRQALIKYLPQRWAEGLRSDIFNNLSRDFDGEPAYNLYIKLKRGYDPQQDKERIERLYRLADGTDDTSITYL